MGMIRSQPIKEYKKTFNLNTFIETGTGGGESTLYAIKSGFDYVYSCEIDKSYYDKAYAMLQDKCPDKEFNIYNEASTTFLKEVFSRETVLGTDRCLFWLDAHLPADDTLPDDIIIPLEQELAVLSSVRNTSKDVIIIDDMVLYEPSLRHPAWKLHIWTKAKDDLISVKDILQFFPNHSSTLSEKDEGALVLTPKT